MHVFSKIALVSRDGLSKNGLYPGKLRSKNALHPVGEVWDPDAFFSMSCVFPHRNVERILQSIQNQALHLGAENDNNDLIQKDDIM